MVLIWYAVSIEYESNVCLNVVIEWSESKSVLGMNGDTSWFSSPMIELTVGNHEKLCHIFALAFSELTRAHTLHVSNSILLVTNGSLPELA